MASDAPVLYIKSVVYSGAESAWAVIAGDYSRLVEVGKNGKVLFRAENAGVEESDNPISSCSVHELYDMILEMPVNDLVFLIDFAEINADAAKSALSNKKLKLGRTLREHYLPSADISGANLAQTYTAAAGEARMSGLNVNIMAIAGNGNHGITSLLGVLAVGNSLGLDREKIARALAISAMITIYVKKYIKRVTALCGCGVAASTGVAAGSVYMMGGSFEQAVDAMHSVIGTLGGMFCDGAKLSCAFKLSTAALMAVQFARMALEGCSIPPAEGIIGRSIEETFENLGRLNDPGMVDTDKVILSIIRQHKADAVLAV